ncbi:ABC transporter ATP-binding protein [Sinorhizobium meliloti]|uniref:ABC transporter ATP-binding protein n=1 Tax=Rhizobium meliloti TaxID=382 RepID=A0AAW9TNF3_RHIML|nr:ABC transporter ATP-binding protein [Sinorhizobium meliloti]MQW33968.1 ABC transporter ATP-binding protein [Sinorhizobium meliloti]
MTTGRPSDRPTDGLQAQILELLRDLQRETGMAQIMITHDLEVAAAMADDRIIVLNGGKVVESGKAEDVFTNPSHAYTRRLMSAVPHADAPKAPRNAAQGEVLLACVQCWICPNRTRRRFPHDEA